MNTFKITYDNGDTLTTQANGTLKEFTDYLMQWGGYTVDKNFVTGEETRKNIVKVEQIESFWKPEFGRIDKCKNCRDMEQTRYFDNGLCGCGVWKHHYHCTECGYIQQIG